MKATLLFKAAQAAGLPKETEEQQNNKLFVEYFTEKPCFVKHIFFIANIYLLFVMNFSIRKLMNFITTPR
jgi:hypothetical protein